MSSGVKGELGDAIIRVGCERDEARADEPLSEQHDERGWRLGLRRQVRDPVQPGGARAEVDQQVVGLPGGAEPEHEGLGMGLEGANPLAPRVDERFGERVCEVLEFGQGKRHVGRGFKGNPTGGIQGGLTIVAPNQ